MHIILLHHKLFCPTVPDQIFLSTCYKPGHFYETRRSILTCVSELLRIDYILTNNRDNCHARHYFFRVETADQLLSLCNPTYSGHAWFGDHGCEVLRQSLNTMKVHVDESIISIYYYFTSITSSYFWVSEASNIKIQ